MSVLVFGHRNPDTDAICSAIAYADLLQRTTRPDAVAACCGPPNNRTEFALRRAGVAAPRIVMDVRPQVEDVCRRDIVTASFGEVFHEAYQRMKQSDLRAIPVIDSSRKVVGVLSVLHLMDLFFHNEDDPIRSRTVATCLQKICNVLGGTFQHAIQPEQRDELLVMVGAMSAEGFTERMQQFPAERLIDPVVDQQFVTVLGRSTVTEARAIVERSQQPVFPVVDDDGVLVGLSFKSDLINPPKPQLVLVDHNELGQAVSGAEEAEIVEVLDHHRLGGGLKSTQPIRFINEPVGSTCTLVARQFRAAGITPTAGIALCMASGIISDTLYLRSPTTTDIDREVLAWLKPLCGTVDVDQYAKEFFEIGSALRSSTPLQVISEDCKEFSEDDVRFSISQIEETGFDLFWDRKDELRAALEDFAAKNRLDFSALLVTDVVSNGSLLLLSHESEAWEEINYPRLDRSLYALKGIVSRKKQLLPLLAQLISTASA